MELTETARRFIVHWGEMGAAWGVNRTMSQIHALLFFHGQPLHADEICATLSVARSNVSTSLRELLNWKLVYTTQVLGNRRTYYATSSDVWTLFRTIIQGRKEREFDPTIRILRALTETPEFAQESPQTQQRVKDTLALMNTIDAWADEAQRLSPETLEKMLRLGARMQKVLRRSKE